MFHALNLYKEINEVTYKMKMNIFVKQRETIKVRPIICILGALFIIGTSGCLSSSPIGTSLDEASATQAITAMCNAVKNKDFSGLYSMTSSEFKVGMSQEAMINRITNGLNWRSDPKVYPYSMDTKNTDYSSGKVNIDRCTIEAVSIQNSPVNKDIKVAQARITWIFDTNQHFIGKPTLVSENGAWKIENYGINYGPGVG